MNFDKTIEKYTEYKLQTFIYDCIESDIREDKEILCNQKLMSKHRFLDWVHNPFSLEDVKGLNFGHDESIDLLRLNWLKEIQRIFDLEFKQFIDDEVYFIGCSFKVYEKTYSKRLKEFQEKYVDASEINFIENEYRETNDNDFISIEHENYPLKFPEKFYQNKKYSVEKREEFLKSKMLELGYEVIYYDEDTSSYYEDFTTTETRYSIIKKQELNNINLEPIKKEIPTIDLSDSKGTEKIIMLYKLGVFDFLRKKEPFNASKNALASALSGITGIDLRTIQSYINPIDNPSANQKNNPLIREKIVNKVSLKLNSIGYKQQE